MTESGEIHVHVREMWPNEAYDFTPWLAKHLSQLGDAVGLKLVEKEQEHQVGSFSLDILAREANEDAQVAIENQLEWTDHSHLGQLLTYTAGTDARIAIWVASEFQYEHAEALHQLNQWAGKAIRFYGVKVELVRSATGDLVPSLRRVVSPDGWDKDLTLPTPPPVNPDIPRYRGFFDSLVADLRQIHPGIGMPRQAFEYRDRFFPFGFNSDMGCVVSFEGEYAWVYLYIRTSDDADLSKRLFDRLTDDRQRIESSIDAHQEWFWQRHNRYSFSTVGVCRRASLDDPTERVAKTRAWMLTYLPKFKEVLEPRLEELWTELSPNSDPGHRSP